jgi:hypothetical protein
LNQLLGRLYSLAADLEGLGVLRTAADIRCVTDGLRAGSGDGLRTEDRIGDAIQRLRMISHRLARGGFARSAGVVARLVDDLGRLHESTPIP